MGTNPNDEVIEISADSLTEELLDQPETGIEPEEAAPVEENQEDVTPEPVDDQEPAEEAEPVDEVDEVPAAKPKTGKTGPLSATIKLERENRKLRRQLAEYRTLQQLEPQQPAQKPAEPVLSPFEKWEQENAEALREDPNLPIPARVMREQRQFEGQQQAQVTATTTAEQEAQQRKRSIAATKAQYAPEEVGDVLSFDTIVSQGAGLLHPDDIRDINAVPGRAGEKAYRLCLQRLKESDPDIAAEINDALRARRQSRQNPANPQSKTKTKAANPPTREQVLNRGKEQRPLRLHQSLGLRMGP